MTIRQRAINITRNYLLLVVATLCIGIYVNVSAQEQNNPLLPEILDKMQQLQSELTELRNQNELTQYQLKTLRDNLDTQLKNMKTQMEIMPTTTTTALPTPTKTDSADSRIKQLAGNIQILERKFNQITSRLDKLGRAIKALEAKTSPTSAPPTTETEQANIPAAKEKEKVIPIKPELQNKNEYAAYSRAISALDRADYTRLRDNLTRFLQDYPSGNYADDASYWVAESYYAEGNLELAESYFTQLLDNYKDSEKRESALLKIAYIRLNNKQWEAARNVLEPLANDAEDKQIRKLAAEQLKQLESRGR